MKASTFVTILILTVAASGSTASFAGCNPAQVSGTWMMFFSDGNYCRVKYNKKGVVLADDSLCVDPHRGTTAPDSGSFEFDLPGECVALGELIVEGVTIDLVLQFTTGRDDGAGAYAMPGLGTKGSLSMVRLH